MKKIRVQNYRAIEDSGMLDLKPITIAVGRNSAGKSSFVRLFPLLKQTLERKIAEPILWYGDYVDFGDFKHTVSKLNNENPIKISFEIDAEDKRLGRLNSFVEIDKMPVTIVLSIREKFFDNITITFYDQIIEIDIDQNQKASVTINGENLCSTDKEVYAESVVGDIIPRLCEKTSSGYYPISFPDLLQKCHKYIWGNNVKQDRGWFGYYDDINIKLGSKDKILSQLKKINKERFEGKRISHKRFLKYNNYILAIKLYDLIRVINGTVTYDMHNTSYIKPIRAMVDRYYRVQGVSIDEIDADGSNLPMILHNMSEKELNEFEKWSKDKFGIIFSVITTEGHISLVIKKELDSEEKTNVADTGYGYSQMLPIVMLLWMIHNSKRSKFMRKMEKTVVIEQPELHLHPAYQAKMMDVFVNILKEARNKGVDLKIIFETHSETMINRLGTLVALGVIGNEDISILIFDKDQYVTKICSKTYDKQGILTGWPVDFFAPEDI